MKDSVDRCLDVTVGAGRRALFVGLGLMLAAALPLAGAHAQKGPEAQERQGGQGRAQPGSGEQKKSTARKPQTGQDRGRILTELYRRLASAEDDSSAEVIAHAIEQVWLQSGSDTVNVLMERAMKSAGAKQYDLALKLLDSVVILAPRYAEGWNRRAYVHFLAKDYGSAVADLKRVLALDSNHFKAIDGLGHILRESGDKVSALQAYQYLLKIHPHWSGAKEAVQELRRDVEGQEL